MAKHNEARMRYLSLLEDIDLLERMQSFSRYEDEGLARRIADMSNEIRSLEDEIEPSFEFAD